MSPKFGITRISPKNEKAVANYARAKNDCQQTGKFKWTGKFNVGDYLGFINDDLNGIVQVEIYKVSAVYHALDERESWWQPIIEQIPTIMLTADHILPATWLWSDIKIKAELAPNVPTWMPLQTQPVKKAYQLPFANPFLPPNNGLDLIASMY
jgi:hypothetical protein